jgi:hypothetical protein
MTRPGDRSVTRADIEAKLAEIKGVADTQVEGAQQSSRPVLVGVGAALVAFAFLAGRRRGRKRSTIVEVRRI